MATNHRVACPSCGELIWITTADHLDIREVSNTKGWTVDYNNKLTCRHCGGTIWVWYAKKR